MRPCKLRPLVMAGMVLERSLPAEGPLGLSICLTFAGLSPAMVMSLYEQIILEQIRKKNTIIIITCC